MISFAPLFFSKKGIEAKKSFQFVSSSHKMKLLSIKLQKIVSYGMIELESLLSDSSMMTSNCTISQKAAAAAYLLGESN